VFVEQVKPYEYRLTCGFIFRSQTPSVSDEEGLHFFPCRRCHVWHSYEVEQMSELRRAAGSARDMAFVTRLDKAIIKDRIVEDLRAGWDEGAYAEIARRHGVSESTVGRIASKLGVSDYGVGTARVTLDGKYRRTPRGVIDRNGVHVRTASGGLPVGSDSR
jgi:hypothetical protein